MTAHRDTPPPPPRVLEGESVTFTGTLASMTHQQAAELVVANGGEATAHLSGHTSILVVGEEGWPLEADGAPSQKYRDVQNRLALGERLRVIRESDWLHLLGLSERSQDVHRLYTPAMLGQMLNLPVSLIRRWEQIGLLTAAKRVYRLPYFDFQEVARLERLSQLLASGVSRGQLERSLAAIGELFPEAEHPRSMLPVLAEGRDILLEDERGLIEPTSRQRLFSFEEATGGDGDQGTGEAPPSLPLRLHAAVASSPAVTASEWHERGCQLLRDEDAASAIEALRMSLMLRPGEPESQFCLADALYRAGKNAAALERYYAVIETERTYVEAWVQIGCLHAEKEDWDEAVAAFRMALDLHPDYPDAHLQLAEALAASGQSDEAADHWRAYLEFDDRGPWADLARQRLSAGQALLPDNR